MDQHGTGSPVLRVDVLVVRTPHDWILTRADRPAATIDDEALHALVRVSGGARLDPDDPARAALEAVGLTIPTGEPEPDPRTAANGPAGGVAQRSGDGEGPALRPEDTVAPIGGFVARVAAGCALIEGRDGARLTLDVTDLMLVEAVREATTIGAVLEAVAPRAGAPGPDGGDADLGARLRRLVEAGRLDLTPSAPPEDAGGAPASGEAPAVEDVAAAPPTTGWKAFVRRHRFPGRRYLIRRYRRGRRLLQARRARSTLEPTAAATTTPPAETATAPAETATAPAETATAPAPAAAPAEAAAPVVRPAPVPDDRRASDLRSAAFLSGAWSAREAGHPFEATVVVGGDGQTTESLWEDLQLLVDHEVPARFVPAGPGHDAPGDELRQVQDAYLAFEQFGILRHVMRFVQWDHGVAATTFLRRVVELSRDDPGRYPLSSWVARCFGSFPLVPLGWRSFFHEVRRFVVDELDVPLSSALDSVLEAQAFLLPEFGRQFPATRALRHDYVAYHADKTADLGVTGRTEPTATPLVDYGPSTLTVWADPLDQCGAGLGAPVGPGHWELDSPLVRRLLLASGTAFRGAGEQGTPGPLR